MSGRFDAYHQWLGIPAREQPPHHYRLLGISEFETDPRVIEAAADRQMAFLRKHQTGEHAAEASKLLSDVSRVRLCLLKPTTKATYDAELRSRLENASETSSGAMRVTSQQSMIVGGIATVCVLIAGVSWWGLSRPGKTVSVTQETASTGSADHKAADPPIKTTSLKASPQAVPQVVSGNPDKKPANLPDGPTSEKVAAFSDPATTPEGRNPSSGESPAKSSPPQSQLAQVQPAGENKTPEVNSQAPTEDISNASRQPVPSAMDQAAALKAVKAQFKAEYGRAGRKPEQMLSLATLLIEQAAKADDPAQVYVLLNEAARLAADAGSSSRSDEAVKLLTQKFAISAAVVRERPLIASLVIPKTPDEAVALLTKCKELADAADGADEYAVAVRVLEAAADRLKKPAFKHLRDKAVWLAKQMAVKRDAFDACQPAREKLKTDPTHAKSSLDWGLFLCFHKSDWQQGLLLLIQSRDKVWAPLAEQELKPPLEAKALLQLGDDWFDAGNKEPDPVRLISRERADFAWQQAWNSTDESLRPKMASAVDQRFLKLFDKSLVLTQGDANGAALPGTERFNPGDEFTIEFWVSTINEKGTLLSKYRGDQESSLVIHLDKGTPQLSVKQGGGEGGSGGGEPVNDGAWHHFALVKTGADIVLFVDGKQVTRRQLKVPLVSLAPWKMGACPERPSTTGRFGRIRISNVARYSESFLPQKSYRRDPDTLYPNQKNDF
jgi:hypothetical protein